MIESKKPETPTAAPKAPIAPALKQYLSNGVLPPDAEGYVWALGSEHHQTSHYSFGANHREELMKEHNLGSVGHESPPYMDVFIWAYRDGKLPVPKEQALNYMRIVNGALAKPEIVKGWRARIRAFTPGVEEGLEVSHFDARHSVEDAQEVIDPFKNKLRTLYKENPRLLYELRTDSKKLETLGAMVKKRFNEEFSGEIEEGKFKSKVRRAFLLLEVDYLLKKNENYAVWLENVEAVIHAGRKFKIGEDAVSAAIFNATRNPSKNAISDSGLGHLAGEFDQGERRQGTFVAHLERMELPKPKAVHTAHFVADGEADIFTSEVLRADMKRMKDAGMPQYELPKLITTTSPSGRQRLDLYLQRYRAARQAYLQTPTPPRKFGAEYIEAMHQKLQTPEMQRLLAKLREPWEQSPSR